MEEAETGSGSGSASGLASGILDLNEEVVLFLEKWYGQEAFLNIRKKLATPPLHTSLRCNTLNTDSQTLINKLNLQFEDHVSKTGNRFEGVPSIPDGIIIKTNKNTSPQQCYPAVVVDKACGESVLRGAHVFIKGILGAANHLKLGDKVSVWADLKGVTLRGEAVNQINPEFVFVGNGITKAHRSLLITQSPGIGIEMTESLYTNPSLNNIFPNELFLQTIPSMLVGHILGPQPGEIILDMCAAPGGKTSHISALCNNACTIVATEKKQGKLSPFKKTLERLGVTCVTAFSYDALKLKSDKVEPSDKVTKTEPPFPPEYFDCIVLDPPCSGLGNRPRLRDDMTLKNLLGFSDYQKRLFEVAFSLLKHGGRLVYSTCTINPLENEELVSWALQKYSKELVLDCVPQFTDLAQPGLPSSTLDEPSKAKVLRFDPSSPLDDIGFFIAKFQKI